MRSKELSTEPGGPSPEGPALIEVDLLGRFAVRLDGVELEPTSWKLTHPRQLLQLLCLQPGHQMHRDLVLEYLWPNGETKASSNRLYHTVHVLRGLLQPAKRDVQASPLLFQSGMLSIAPSCKIVVDLLRFRELVARARHSPAEAELIVGLEEALAVMGTVNLDTSADPHWLAPHRDEARRDHVWALERLARLHDESERTELAATALRRLVELEPTNEPAHRRLMELFDAAGQPERAVQQFTACKRYLHRDLAAAPSPATVALLDTIVNRASTRNQSAAVATTAVAKPVVRPAYTAPTHAVPLLGREADLALLSGWLTDEQHRLVTIAAAGGIGKTRLALALAQAAQGRYRDGVLVVPLTGVSDAGQLEATICRAAGWVPSQEQPAALLRRELSARQLLLVLDRFEHVVEASPRVSEMLAAAPGLQIVATSQCRLNCSAEWVHALAPLTQSAPLAAVELFEQTARLAGVATPLNRTVVAEICERLEGNALGIELAAARLPEMTLQQLLKAIARPLELLVNPAADAEAPQRSLRAAIAWSVSLLDDATRHLLYSLAAFTGAFSLDQIRTVTGLTDCESHSRVALQALLERHLLSRADAAAQHPGTARFALLDSIHQFAHAAAPSMPQWQAVRAAHAHLFAQTLLGAYAALRDGQKLQANAEYRAASLDIDQALRWHFEQNDLARSLHLAYRAATLQLSCGYLLEGVQRLQAVTAHSARTPQERQEMGWCWLGLASGSASLGDISAAVYATRMCRRFLDANDDLLAHRAFTTLAILRSGQLRVRATSHLLEKTRRISNAHPDARTQAVEALQVCNVRLVQGRYAQALHWGGAAMDHALAADHMQFTSLALQAMSQACVWHGDVLRADTHMDECLLLNRAGLSNFDSFDMRLNRFHVAFESNDFARAQRYLDAASTTDSNSQTLLPVTVQLAREFLLMEAADETCVDDLPVISRTDFPPSQHLIVFYVKRHCYRLRLAADAGDWAMANDSLDRLADAVCRSRNLLWASWAAEASGHALLALGQAGLARVQLNRSRERQVAFVLSATPRQKASWQRLEQRLDAIAAQGAARHQDPQSKYFKARLGHVNAALDTLAERVLRDRANLNALPA